MYFLYIFVLIALVVGEETTNRTKSEIPLYGYGIFDNLHCGTKNLSVQKWEKKHLNYEIQYDSNTFFYYMEKDSKSAIKRAFEIWSQVVDLTFSETNKTESADIIIAFKPTIYMNLDFNDREMKWGREMEWANQIALTTETDGKVYIIFDKMRSWKYVQVDNWLSYHELDFVYVALHQIGHALGINHHLNKVRQNIMHSNYLRPSGKKDAYIWPHLKHDDVLAMRELYGAYESINLTESQENCDKYWSRLDFVSHYNLTNKYYILVRGVLNHSEVQQYCKNFGGALVSIHSRWENHFVQDFMKENKVSEALIGLSLTDDQINWKWDDNSEVDYINWDKNEPNHVMSSEYLVEILLHGRWNDVPDEHNRVAICQISCEEKILPSEDPNKWKKYGPEDQEEAKLLLGEILVVTQTGN